METERFERFIAGQVSSGGLSEGTARKYREAIGRFAEWRRAVGHSPSSEATVAEMEDFLVSLGSEEGLQGATLNVYKCALGKFLTVTGRAGEYPNLKAWFSTTYRSSSGGTVDYLTKEEAAAVREAASSDARDNAIVTLFLRTGMRVGELVALDMEDIIFEDDGTATVRISRQKRREDITDERTLTREEARALRAYIFRREEYGPEDADALFISGNRSADGSYRLTDKSVRLLVTDIGNRAYHDDVTGDRLHPHLFRHTVGAWLGQEGYSADQIGAYLGKASPATRYTHFDTADMDDMSESLTAEAPLP